MGFGHLALCPGDSCPARSHSFEQSIFMLAGELLVELADREVSLAVGDTIRLPVAVAYALRNEGADAARWIEMAAPQPRTDPDLPPDTFVVGTGAAAPAGPEEGDDVLVLRAADPKTGDRRSRSVGDAVERIDHLSLQMLVEHPLGLHSMFIADAGPGAYLGPHDHPHEEAYLMLEGRCEWTFDGKAYLLQAGDVAWSGVGTIHAMHNVTDEPCRWLETQAPMPAARHAIRYF
ncbi:MAG TPA: cupin domain-containing protein [Polyangia bacterium]|nr:cupin domain-containing protein [Polyangia bacterium]